MRSGVVHLVIVLLLLAQGLVAIAPGRTVCIRLVDCGRHGQMDTCEHQCESTCESACDHDETLIADHPEHAPPARTGHSHEDCGCHVCVPVPRCDAIPNTASREGDVATAIALPLVVVAVISWHVASHPVLLPGYRPPDVDALPQAVSLRVTRLLI